MIPEHIEALGESYARLWKEFSEFPTREEVSARIRIFKPKSLANLDCQGRGPAGRRLIGGKVCYHRDQVIIWFASLSGSPKSKDQVFASSASVAPGVHGVSASGRTSQPKVSGPVSADSGQRSTKEVQVYPIFAKTVSEECLLSYYAI